MKLSLIPRFHRRPRTARSSSNRRPLLECLEDRLAPAASFTATTLVDGYFTSGRLNTTGNEIRLDLSADRGLLEFDLSSLNPAARISSATLTGTSALLNFDGASGLVVTDFYTYAGDGSISLNDASVTDARAFGGRLEVSSLGEFSVPINVSAIQPLIGTTNYLGIEAQKISGGVLWMTSTEGASTGAAPLKLTLTYTLGPAGSADTYRMIQDGTLAVAAPGVLANDNNPDSVPAITAVLASLPANGSVSLNPDGSFFYTPVANFQGIDQFTYRLESGTTSSAPIPVTIKVTPPAELPVAVDSMTTVTAGTSATISVVPPALIPLLQYGFDEDVSGSGASVVLDTGSSPAANGTIVGSVPRTAQTPGGFSPGALDLSAPGLNHIDAGDADKLDGLNELTLTTWINLRDVTKGDVYNPIMSDDFISAPAGDAGWMLAISSRTNLSDPLSTENFRLAFGVSLAQESSTGYEWAFSPLYSTGGDWVFIAMTFNSSGLVSFYQGGQHTSASMLGVDGISYHRLGNNSAPFRIGQSSFSLPEDRTPPVWLDDVRVYGSALTLEQVERVRDENITGIPDVGSITPILVTGPTHGSLTLNADGSYIYTPDPGFLGSDLFTYKLTNGPSESNIAYVFLNVIAPPNIAPIANNDAFVTVAILPLNVNAPGVLGNDSDPDGNSLTASLVTGPQHGVLTLNPDGSFIYTPFVNYLGLDSFSYKVHDGSDFSETATVTLTVTKGSAASFVGTDATTQGSWKGVYGQQGGSLAQDASGGVLGIPSYATVTLWGQNSYTWAASTSDAAALEKPAGPPADRLAATWYASDVFAIHVRINDGQTHQIALYALDWLDGTRLETIQLVDTTSYSELDSRSIANFANGVYLVWNVSGDFIIRVTSTAGPNAVLSGLFFDPVATPSSASFLAADTTTEGSWKNTYGSDGHNLAQDTTGGNPSIPAYASVTLRGQNNYTWATNTSLPAALEKSTGTSADRLAATWYAANSFEIDVRIHDGQTHQIALYALDWNDGTRSQTIQLFDTVSGTQLDSRSIANFSNGVYLVWNVSGRVTIKVTRTAGPNAVLSGLFFDPETAPSTASFVKTDTTTQGAWKSQYGGDGHNLAQDTSGGNPILPAYASVALKGKTDYTWAASTTDAAALVKSTGSSTDRLAATWYAANSFEIDVRFDDANSHRIALYALDWHDGSRSQTIELFDTGTGALLDTQTIANFQNGVYLVWNVTGRITIKVTKNTGPNAVLSGLFFG